MLALLNLSMVKQLPGLFVATFWSILWLFSFSLLLIIFLLRWWPGDQLLIVRVVNYSMPWLLILLVPSLLAASIADRKLLAVTLALSTIFIVIAHAKLFINKKQEISIGYPIIKVMSYNVWSRNLDLPGTVRVIEQANPDILLVQELTPANFEKISKSLSNLFPAAVGSVTYDAKTFLATFSRYPLTPLPMTIKGPVQKTVIQTPAGPVTVFNVHFLRTVLRHRSNWQRLTIQIKTVISEEIARTSGPLIIGGDFNTTDQTQTYRLVSDRLRNAHREAGYGFGFTFPAPSRKLKGRITLPPLVRIDHLFYNDKLVAHRAGTLSDAGGSDHFPIIAEFLLTAP